MTGEAEKGIALVDQESGASMHDGLPRVTADIPFPKYTEGVDRDKAQKWIDEESDPRLREMRKTLMENVKHVSFEEFTGSLTELMSGLREELGSRRYRTLLDRKPHSSKYWVAALVEQRLGKRLKQKSFFTPGWEEMNDCPTLKEDMEAERNTYLVLDDGIYSGTQVIDKAILPVVRHAKKVGRPLPEFIVAAPYMTHRAVEKLQAVAATEGIKIEIRYEAIMPTITEALTAEQKRYLEGEKGGIFSEEDGEPLYQGATLTFFDHRVADEYSFSGEVRKALQLEGERSPYGDSSTDFYKEEEDLFNQYRDRLIGPPVED